VDRPAELRRAPPLARRLAIGVSAMAILAITLAPAGTTPPLPFSASIGEGRRWLSDGILNLFLFVPLGFALVWERRSIGRAVFIGLLLSTAVEIAQLWIPGRDSSLSDILFNAAGTLAGALLGYQPRTWIFPEVPASRKLLVMALAAVATVLLLTALLLSPEEEAWVVTRQGTDLVLVYPSRADNLGLDAPVYWLPGLSGDSVAHRIVVRRERARWLVASESHRLGEIGPTVGDGWALLGYPDAIGRRWRSQLSVLWVMVLCGLVGYWARGGVSLTAAGVAIALLLFLIPLLVGIERTPVAQWFGAALGLFAGVVLGVVSQRLAARCDDTGAVSELRRLSEPAL
jgi:VanZ family protein